MRSAMKRLVERVLRGATAGIENRKGGALILAYHNVVSNEQASRGDQSLHLPFDRFRRHLDAIQRHSRPVSLTEILNDHRDRERPCVALTFDDAYRGAVEIGIPEVTSRGLACTVFVAPGLLGARSFWWDDVAEKLGGMTERVRTDLLESEAGQDDSIRGKLLSPGESFDLPASYQCVEESQLDRLGELPGIVFGSHSWSHPNLARLDAATLRTELERSHTWLRNKGWPVSPCLAYPYGLYSTAVEEAAKAAGYGSGLAVAGGWLPASPRSWSIPRLNVPAGLSADGLLLRLRGVLPSSGSR